MDNGVRIDVESTSAAEAMQTALERHIGHRVVECFSGKEHGQQAGVIRFEIPRHDPVMVARPKRERKKKAERSEAAAPWIEDFLAAKSDNELPP